MSITVVEGISFGISLILFIYGIVKVYLTDAPFYFKLIVGAVGCYTLEELWIVVNAICGYENSVLSVRLIGIFGCYCALLTASTRAIKQIADDKAIRGNAPKILSFIAPIAILIAFAIFYVNAHSVEAMPQIIIQLLVILPACVDSYFELRCLISPNDEKGVLKCIKPINALALVIYAISVVYLFVITIEGRLILDIISAITIAFLVLASRRGAKKWKTLT